MLNTGACTNGSDFNASLMKAVARIEQQDPAQGHRQQRHEEADPQGELDEAPAGNPDADQEPGDQEADEGRDRRPQRQQEAVADSAAIGGILDEGLVPDILGEGAERRPQAPAQR